MNSSSISAVSPRCSTRSPGHRPAARPDTEPSCYLRHQPRRCGLPLPPIGRNCWRNIHLGAWDRPRAVGGSALAGMRRFCSLAAPGLLALAGAAVAAEVPLPAHLLEKNCTSCHNATDWAGGLAFDTLTFENLRGDADIWEETLRKLRGRLMPPPGEPQPTQQEVDATVRWLEARLDAEAAAAPPDPGYVG